MKSIYFAGFDVFAPDAAERGEQMKKICKSCGFVGRYPLDNQLTDAAEIFNANIGMIRECDIIAANVNSFRGAEPDSGTCFEIGFAYALGKKIYCYTGDGRTLREKLGETDSSGMNVEDFGYPLNLMLSVPSEIVIGDFEDCIRKISADNN